MRPARPHAPVRAAVLLLALALALAGSIPLSVRSQTEVRFFPETGHTLRGAFRAFWENNGAIDNFGFPITEEYTAANGRLTQWFERARFELTTVNGQPAVELGKLGVEITGGRIFPKSPPIQNTATRRYFPETQQILQYGFKEIWETRGGLTIFGLPLSSEIQEVLEDGEWHTVQYFERARFEYWPNFPPGKRVLVSRLGSALAPKELTAPVGAPPPAATPAPAPPAGQPIPPSVNSTVTPQSGPPGTTFVFAAQGFEPGERVGIWLTAPDQSTVGANFQATADRNGSITHENIGVVTNENFIDGIWSFNAQGVKSGKQATGYFRVSRSEPPR